MQAPETPKLIIDPFASYSATMMLMSAALVACCTLCRTYAHDKARLDLQLANATFRQATLTYYSNRPGEEERHSNFGASALPGLLTPSGRTAAEAAPCKRHYTKFTACCPLRHRSPSACKFQYAGPLRQLQ